MIVDTQKCSLSGRGISSCRHVFELCTIQFETLSAVALNALERSNVSLKTQSFLGLGNACLLSALGSQDWLQLLKGGLIKQSRCSLTLTEMEGKDNYVFKKKRPAPSLLALLQTNVQQTI